MEENITPRPRQRRRKTKMELFKEAYLPYLILMAAVVIIIVFIIGAVARSNQTAQPDPSETTRIVLAESAEV